MVDNYVFFFFIELSHNALQAHFLLLPSKMAAIPAISMYRLPTYYEEMVVPLPKCMYRFPSYFQTNSQMEVSRLVLIACCFKE